MGVDLLLSDEMFPIMQPLPQLSSVVDGPKGHRRKWALPRACLGPRIGSDTRLPSFMRACEGSTRIPQC